MPKIVKMADLKQISDETKGVTKIVIQGNRMEDGYLLNHEFAVYVDTDQEGKSVVEEFRSRLEAKTGESVAVFHIHTK